MLSRRATAALVGVITCVWVANVAAGIFIVDYDPSGVNLIFGAVVSGLLVYRNTNNGERNGNGR